MARHSNYLIPLAAMSALWGRTASADGDSPSTAPTDAPTDAPANATPEPTAPVPEPELDCTNLTPSDCALAKASMQAAETVVIYDERPTKPFDRDTEVRLTGEQLAARGATDLATALSLLPDVTVRDAGRGGFNIDIRGGRKGDVSVLVDGVLVTDPYYGTFDLTSIPITDIVEIRIATTPQSPIDGPGGPGGVIEVHTRDAIGPQLIIGRLTGDTLPSFGLSFMARAPLAEHLAMRVSASGVAGARDLTLAAPYTSINEARHDSSGAARFEYRNGDRRAVVDGYVDDRHYVVPPNENSSSFLLVDREDSARLSAKGDDRVGDGYQVQAEAWFHYLHRRSRTFQDPTEAKETIFEDLSAVRTGGQALATHAIGKDLRWAASATIDRETVEVRTLSPTTTVGDTTVTEGAGDLQYEHGTVRVDGAAGLAVPFGVGADPWPEAKLVVRWRPSYGPLELTATGGRKGRVPSLRERFEPGDGNPKLAPEQADHAELRAIEHVGDRVHLELAPFYRHTDGSVRISQTQDVTDPSFGKLVNLGVVNFWGVDTLGRVRVQSKVELGGGYSYIRARSVTGGVVNNAPLDRLPHHRWEAWAQVTPRAGLSGLVRVTYFGENVNQGMTLPGFATLEVTGTWQLARGYMIVARGEDLTRSTGPQTRPGVFGPGRVLSIIVQGTFE